MDPRGATIAITGGGQGIGRALALHFAKLGANVALLDVQQSALDESASLCGALGVTARPYLTNVADEAEAVASFAAIARDFGRLDVLVNNAGIIRDALLVKVKDGEVVGKLSLAQWQAVIDVNLTGVFLCGREAAEHMIRFGRGGVIVNISSISRAGNAGQSNYSAAKAGVVALATVWAKELARHRIRAAAIAPGFVATPILEAMKPEMLAKMTAPVPAGRLAKPDEIASTVEFIVRNDYLNGRCIDVDGGLRL